MKIPANKLFSSSERQRFLKACKLFNIPINMVKEESKRFDGSKAGIYKLLTVDLETLIACRDGYQNKYDKGKHYSSYQAVIGFNNLIKQFEKYMEKENG